eukprot:12881053-Prorocentrum_lima.AAC.1
MKTSRLTYFVSQTPPLSLTPICSLCPLRLPNVLGRDGEGARGGHRSTLRSQWMHPVAISLTSPLSSTIAELTAG